jgi:ABC-type glycerol-3-phosphate transport system substrate-binding protein
MNRDTHPRARLTAALAVTAVALAACGGDDESSADEAPPSHTVADVRACFEEAGEQVHEIEISFVKIPPDIGVASKAGSADVWVTDDEAELEKVIAQGEELAQLGDPSGPQSELLVSGNAAASVGSSKPEYRSVVEECLPPS